MLGSEAVKVSGLRQEGGKRACGYCIVTLLGLSMSSWQAGISALHGRPLNGYSCTAVFKYNVLQIGFLSEQSPWPFSQSRYNAGLPPPQREQTPPSKQLDPAHNKPISSLCSPASHSDVPVLTAECHFAVRADFFFYFILFDVQHVASHTLGVSHLVFGFVRWSGVSSPSLFIWWPIMLRRRRTVHE